MDDSSVGRFAPASGKASVDGVPGRGSMPAWYPALLDAVTERVTRGQVQVVLAANQAMVEQYWGIGQEILTRQIEEGWGARIIDRLASDLRRRFPEARGFSARNLKYMRAFAAAWPDWPIVQRSVAQLPWRHQIALLEKLQGPDLRQWYAERALIEGWSRDTLVAQIAGRVHERQGKAVTNFAATLPSPQSDLAQQVTKDPYLLDFVGAAHQAEERLLEAALLEHIQDFLLELGQGFAFVGRQVPLRVGESVLYADLVFYHFVLRCFVVVELKTVKFETGFLSQLGAYLAIVDDTLRQPDDQPTIGILLCRSKDATMAEYALRSMNGPIGVADWATELQTSLPRKLRATLPSIEELEAELAAADKSVGFEAAERKAKSGDS